MSTLEKCTCTFQGQNHPLCAKGLDVSCPHQGQTGFLEQLFCIKEEMHKTLFYDQKLFFQSTCKHKIYFKYFSTFLYMDVTAMVPCEDMCCFS